MYYVDTEYLILTGDNDKHRSEISKYYNEISYHLLLQKMQAGGLFQVRKAKALIFSL
jgi:hypothetical protein